MKDLECDLLRLELCTRSGSANLGYRPISCYWSLCGYCVQNNIVMVCRSERWCFCKGALILSVSAIVLKDVVELGY